MQILNRVASRRSKPKWGENGVEAVVAFLCHELEWQVEDADLFILSSHAGEKINLKHYSKTFFREELGRACRRYLLRQVPQRQDCHIGADLPDVDIFLTRFLEDTSFQQSEDFSLLKPFLDRLPPDFFVHASHRSVPSFWFHFYRPSLASSRTLQNRSVFRMRSARRS